MDICFNMDAKRRGGQQARVNPTEYRSTVVCIAISVRAEIELIGVERVTTSLSLSLSFSSSSSHRGIDTFSPKFQNYRS